MIVPEIADAKPVIVPKKGTRFEIKNATPTKKHVIAVQAARETFKASLPPIKKKPLATTLASIKYAINTCTNSNALTKRSPPLPFDAGKFCYNILFDTLCIAARCGPVGRRRRRNL